VAEQFGTGAFGPSFDREREAELEAWELEQLPSFRGPKARLPARAEPQISLPELRPASGHEVPQRAIEIANRPHRGRRWPALRALVILAALSGAAVFGTARFAPPEQTFITASKVLAALRLAFGPAEPGVVAAMPAPVRAPQAKPATAALAVPLSPPAPPQTPLSPELARLALERGDAFMRSGDVASARPFYELAARSGVAGAAQALALTYDPAFLARIGARGVRGDPAKAAEWYAKSTASRERSPAASP